MLDNKLLRKELDFVKERMAVRGFEADWAHYTALDERRRHLQMETEALQAKRNQAAKAIGQAVARGEEVEAVKKSVADLGDQLKDSQSSLQAVQASLDDFCLNLPNLPHADVPPGKDDSDNQLIRDWGDTSSFDFEAKDHVDLGENLGLMDFSAAARLSGSRFCVLRGDLARLQRALAAFMLDVHTRDHGYTECDVPILVKDECLVGTGQFPKFKEDVFSIAGEWDFSLISTAEIALTNLAREQILDTAALPCRYVAQTPCFRSEAGSYGRDTRGLIRQHQFEKVELVQLVRPDDSADTLEAMLGHAERIMQDLKLPYRVVMLCGGDLGFSAVKTYDIEVWLPSQKTYREISSVSNCESFQARRMQARFYNGDGKPELLHTLNGSGVAVGRALIAVLENYQQADGSIVVPDCLQPYLGGQTLIATAAA